MNNLKDILKDILYVSKLTKTKNKKILIVTSVILSQLTAMTDLLLIGVFAAIIADQFTNIELINSILKFIVEFKIVIVLLVFFRYFINYSQASILKKIELDVLVNLRSYIFSKILEQKNYSKSDTYYFINQLCGHISFFYSSFAQFLNHLFQAGAYILYLSISDISLFSIFLVCSTLLLYPIKKLILISRNYMHKTFLFGQDANSEIERIVENLFLIKILKMEKYEIEKFTSTMQKIYKFSFRNYQVTFVNQQLPNFFTLFIFSLILNFSKFITLISLDFLGVTLRLFQSLSVVSNSLNQVANSQVHIEKFAEIDKFTKNSIKNFYKVHEENNILLQNVDFKYINSDSYIFKNINLNITKNTHNLIIGPNGSGKSTLLGIIGNVLTIESGIVKTFSEKFALIGATPFIFRTSLKENLIYGNEKDIPDKVLIEMLEKFEVFKEKANNDLNKIVDNTSLSSGQMQKIAFIRALLSEPDILLLDEAMANLDDKAKQLVIEIVKDQKITIINSTHDPEKYESADNVISIKLVNEERVLSSTN